MGTWITGAVVVCIVALALYKIYKDKKSGKECGGCESRSCCPNYKPPS
ncbi:MAG: FeoB-associated Cys-rich membrane protein [Treponema sp.]|nr:FeoB-associated Cys-rich membrane protein [Treponema sp.]